MANGVFKAFLVLMVTVSIFMWIGSVITDMTGGERTGDVAVDVSPESGESIFWGKGRCFTCHSMGGEGSAVRCPNLGQFGEKFPLAIGSRAEERAKERSEQTGIHYTATDYLIESVAKPDAYIVEGFKDEMAIVYAPPISLNLTEIKAVVSYLQTQGGELDIDTINAPSELAAEYYGRVIAATAAGGGDPGAGMEMFEYNCIDCHAINGEGGEVGPELSNASALGLKMLEESVLRPAAKITAGYETWEVTEKDGRKTTGLKTSETAAEVAITLATGEVVTIATADIQEIVQDEGASVMPDDLTEALTVKDFQDVLAYLMMQKTGE